MIQKRRLMTFTENVMVINFKTQISSLIFVLFLMKLSLMPQCWKNNVMISQWVDKSRTLSIGLWVTARLLLHGKILTYLSALPLKKLIGTALLKHNLTRWIGIIILMKTNSRKMTKWKNLQFKMSKSNNLCLTGRKV